MEQRIAFRMKLFPGKEKEYKKRHDEIWPELKNSFKRYRNRIVFHISG